MDEAEIKGVLLGFNGFTLVNWGMVLRNGSTGDGQRDEDWIACMVTDGEGRCSWWSFGDNNVDAWERIKTTDKCSMNSQYLPYLEEGV